jgi:hypothetical protein
MRKNQALAVRRPFSSVWQAAALLDCSERRVYDCIQEGRLTLAFNIGRRDGRRACMRLATASVVALQRHLRPPCDLEPFLAGALPDSQFSYKTSQLAWLLQCDSDHIYRLIAEKELEDIGGSIHYRVPRASMVHFLTARRVK